MAKRQSEALENQSIFVLVSAWSIALLRLTWKVSVPQKWLRVLIIAPNQSEQLYKILPRALVGIILIESLPPPSLLFFCCNSQMFLFVTRGQRPNQCLTEGTRQYLDFNLWILLENCLNHFNYHSQRLTILRLWN